MPVVQRSAVLLSGGVDSAVLLAEEASRAEVQPIYVSVGLAWEPAERVVVDRFLANLVRRHAVGPLVALSLDMSDVYAAGHWAIRGRPPGYHTPDQDVYLPGRNVVLAAKASVFCAAAGISRLAIGTLAGNPFPDATHTFRDAMGHALSLGLDHPLEVVAPYAPLHKSDVIRRGARLGVPFELTLSCMNPASGSDGPVHCGLCSKCRERHDAFVAAGRLDPAPYHNRRHVGA